MKSIISSFAFFFLFAAAYLVKAQEPGMSVPPPDKNQGTIGLVLDNMQPAYVSEFKLKKDQTGIVVINVVAGSAGEKAGFKKGDIINSINKIKVQNTKEFKPVRARYKVGDMLELAGVSAGKPYVRRIKIAAVA